MRVPHPHPDTDTCLLLRPERPRPPRRIYCPHSLFVALSQLTAKSRPAAHPLASRGSERGKRAGRAAPAPGKGTRAASGVPQLRFYSRQGEEDAAAQDGRGSSGLGAGGVEREPTPRGERGALGRAGSAGPAGAQDSGATRRRRQRRASKGMGGGGGQDLGRRDGQTAPIAGEGGRLRVLGAQGGVPGGRERGNLRAEVQGDSAWCSSSGPGALDPKRPTWVEGHARPGEGERRRVIRPEKQMEVKLVRLPGGGEQAGECGQEHEAGQESRGGCEAVGTE